MKGDYGTFTWVNDEHGKEYVCTVEKEHFDEDKYENLTDDERNTCVNVNEMVGTERW